LKTAWRLGALAVACAALSGPAASAARIGAGAPPAPHGADAARASDGAHATDAAIAKATRRALAFIYRSSSKPANFREYGEDYVWCFFTVAHTAADPELAHTALVMARERARTWRHTHRSVPRGATADDISNWVSGGYAADLLGVRDDRFKGELRTAARRFTADDYLRFDPAKEAPPSYLPDCDACPKKHAPLRSRYDVLLDALIVTYFGDAYGIRLGASHREVMRWLPRMRPYPSSGGEYEDAFYAVSHVVYTLNGYGEKRIAPRLLPQEVAFLRHALAANIVRRDAETVGEGLDTLTAFGFDRGDPLIARGMAYLLATQRPDGSWSGDPSDVYTQYHSAWTGLDGLRRYRFRSEVEHL
jgi:hypothetical protein